LTAALDAARPGINSVAEAMKTLGVTSDASLKQTAATAKEAYDTLRTSGTASARELQDAFAKYAETAIKANGGVASESLKAEAAMRGLSIEGGKAGDSISRAMQGAQGSVQALGNQVQFTTEQLAAQAKQLDEINAKYGQSQKDREFKTAKVGSGNGSVLTKDPLTAVDNTGLTSLQAKRRNGTLSAEDLRTAQAVFDSAAVNKDVFDKNATAFSAEGARSIMETYNAARVLLDEVKGLGNTNTQLRRVQPNGNSPGNRSKTAKLNTGQVVDELVKRGVSVGDANGAANNFFVENVDGEKLFDPLNDTLLNDYGAAKNLTLAGSLDRVAESIKGSTGQKAGNQQTYLVKLDLGGGRTRDVNVASANDAQALINSLREARLAA
jgi:hypothetical protein